MSWNPIANLTTSSTTNTVTFTNITQSYKDLFLVMSVEATANYASIVLTFNNDSGNNYSVVYMRGDSGGASSFNNLNYPYYQTFWSGYATNAGGMSTTHILDYSATDKYKTALTRVNTYDGSKVTDGVAANAGIWKNTSAITTLKVSYDASYSQNWKSGATFALYGIGA